MRGCVRMMEGTAKLCQRQLYSWLSSRCGLPVCVVGMILLLVSLLQFGEVFLTWSKEKYEYQFSIYADNIAGKSFERFISPELPIDIVYTWVNGSDPVLLAELRELKRQMKSREPVKNSTHKDRVANSSLLESPCPFSHCVPFNTLLLDARQIPTLPLSSARSLSSLLTNASSCEVVNSTAIHLTPVHAIHLPSEDEVSQCLATGIKDSGGRKILATRGLLTSDSSVVGVVKMEDFALLMGAGIKLTNRSSHLQKWAESRFRGDVISVEVKVQGVAVAHFRSHAMERILERANRSSLSFLGQPLTVLQAHLIWMPFTLPDTPSSTSGKKKEEESEDEVISASRFQDNEELRYSLRSVAQHAPWVRHIFIVTSGQIPAWINLDNPRITLVTHEEIFHNRSHLPSYSSPSIETHLHRIPGLSKRFIYLNDDVMFGTTIWPEDFYTPQHGQKVYLSWPVPYCSEGCPSNWITDHYCDQACNNSMCDWDGGDCKGASRYGWQGGHTQTRYSWNARNTDTCNTGCLNNWLGDRYCDQACRVPNCGYDAGDCGTELWHQLVGVVPRPRHDHHVPLGTTAMFFNLSSFFTNGSGSSAHHTPSPLIRTAVFAQHYKTLSLTFSRNVTRHSVQFNVTGSNGRGKAVSLIFNLTADTATPNRSVVADDTVDTRWSFPEHKETNSMKFLRAVAEKMQDMNHSISYWITEHSSQPFTPPSPTLFVNYTVPNATKLPADIASALANLEEAWLAGDLTRRGYMRRRNKLLEPYRQLLVANGSTRFPGGMKTGGGEKEREGQQKMGEKGEKGGVGGGGGRRLLGVLEAGVAKERSRNDELRRSTAEWEHKYGPWDPLYRRWESRWLPWEKLRVFPQEGEEERREKVKEEEEEAYTTASHKGRRLMDIYGDSLRFVNKLLTQAYGHNSRKVPAHMPHMINKEIMEQLQLRYPQEFAETSSHQLRSANDMQFSFSYFYFLMSERREMELAEAFEELDTDKSGILSVRELRTLLARVSDLPLHLGAVHSFEDLLRDCQKHYNGTPPSVAPMEYEINYDPNLPLINVDFVRLCRPLLEKLNKTFHVQNKYKFEVVGEEEVAFKMINENATKVMEMLDEIRKHKKKFICLNDNIDHSKDGAQLAKLILQDFYESLFPHPSPFELSPQYRNRFLHITELREWLMFRGRIQLALHIACGLLLTLSIFSLCYGKIVQFKRRLFRFLGSLITSHRTRSSV